MSKLALVLAAAALALGIWQMLENQATRDEVRALQEERTSLRAQLASIERAHPDRAATLPAPGARLATGDVPSTPENAPRGPTLVAKAASPAVLAEAVRDLQDRVAKQEEKVENVAARVEDNAEKTPRFFRRKFLRSVADAAKLLDLSATQRADLERVTEYAKQDIKDLYAIPNDEGKTLADVSKPVKVGGEGSGIAMMMSNFGAIQQFKRSKVPGRSETYAEAEQRIRSEAKREARDLLAPDQRKTWDNSTPDALFGPSTGASISVMSFSTSSSDDEDEK